MSRRIHTLTIPSSTRYLENVRRFVADHASDAAFSDQDVEHLKMAVDEACTNVIEHAYRGEGEHPIDVAVIVRANKFTVRIRDEGVSFDSTSYSEPDLEEYVRRRRSGGFGVHLMRRLMDHVEYRTRGNTNECRLTKYRRNAT